MIERDEIKQKADEFGINTSDVQRDYVFGWFLRGLFSASDLRDRLFLKGGNALRKGYFENTRYSADLDFGMEGDIEQGVLEAEIAKICEFVAARSGIVFDPSRNHVREKFGTDQDSKADLKVYEVRVYFKDLYGVDSEMILRIKMDLTRFDRTYLAIQERPLIHPYTDSTETGGTIRCLKLEEIVAIKLKCLMQREHVPDLFDYVYAVFDGKIALDKGEVIGTFLKKTIFEPSPGIAKKILLELPLAFVAAQWRGGIVAASSVLFDPDTAIMRFREGITDMFAPYPEVSYADDTYFPAQFRYPILQAGRTQTLVRMRYKGHERLVEPYALKYKQAENQPAREYFFGFDQTGGSSGKKGIKSFLANGVEAVENTDIKFTPQGDYEIELAKAGEPVTNPEFGDPNRPRPVKSPRVRVPRVRTSFGRAIRAPYHGPKHVFRCSACNKRVTKRSMDGSLGKHKNRFGGYCYSTFGIYETTRW